MNKSLYLYDTTLRDGAQFKGISFSLQDKLSITQLLDDFGMDYIEAGWPGSNPKDAAYFEQAKNLNLKHATLVAFGATRKPDIKVQQDPQIQSLLSADTPAVALVAKFWQFHIEKVLHTSLQENLNMIFDSVAFFKQQHKELILDAEHFFDGFKDNPDYCIECLQVAIDAGVDNVTLCDTNGGTLPQEIATITQTVAQQFPRLKLGIHCHNDCELAVANSLQAVNSGVSLIQGTINGYGERCGNANLVSLIANLMLKDANTRFAFNATVKASKLTKLSNDIANIANIPLKAEAAYVGNNAFSHKGGIHVAAIAKASRTYEHIAPSAVGNQRDIAVSELSGRSNIKLQAKKLGLDVSLNFQQVLDSIKELEHSGFSLENASGSFEMLVRKHDISFVPHFSILNIQISTVDFNQPNQNKSELCTAIVKLKVKQKISHVVAEATGPVDALNLALKKALSEFFPSVAKMKLTDYKVSIINPEKASAATTRVWIESGYQQQRWATIGCSDNIIKASTQALVDSYQLFLIKFADLSQTTSSKEVIPHGNT
ncbi:citramalate synthase [Kangiella sp.]|uniref:citramalate synthase n=1 Tax=Kangiella sp. TaxID=1920245 RepID=UPI003A9300D3